MTSLPVLMSHSLGMTSVSARLRCVFIRETKSHYLTRIRFLCQLFSPVLHHTEIVFYLAPFPFPDAEESSADFLKQTLGVGWGKGLLMFVYHKVLHKVARCGERPAGD